MLVAILLKRLAALNNAEEHLEFIATLIGASKEEMDSFIPQGNPREFLELICTKGGVSESIVNTIKAEPDIPPRNLFERTLKYVNSM